MILINKQPKLSCHMASMPINDRRLIMPVMLICQCTLNLRFKFVLSKTCKVMTLYPHMYQNVYGILLQKKFSIQE